MWVGGHNDMGFMAFARLLMSLAPHTHLPGTQDQAGGKGQGNEG